MARLSVASSTENRRPMGARPPFAAFVTDSESESIIRRALGDLATEPESVQRGEISKAVEYLGNHRSPDLLIVDISNLELPLSKVRQLSDVCEPGVQVIVIGNRNEVGLYRDLIHAGIADYIVKPLTADLVRKAIELTSHSAAAAAATQKVGKVIAVTGTRGGIGTTTVAVNLAWYLANRAGRRVALVDLDLQTGDSSLMLDIKATSALREALENSARVDRLYLERVMVAHGERLFVLNAEEALSDELRITPEGVETLVTSLQTEFHYVVLDLPRTPSAATRRAIDLATQRVLVSDETIRSAREIVRLRGILNQGRSAAHNLLVINRSGEHRPGYIPRKEFLGTIEMPAAVTIPVVTRNRNGPAEYGGPAAAHRGPIAQAIEALAGEISGRPVRQAKWWTPWR